MLPDDILYVKADLTGEINCFMPGKAALAVMYQHSVYDGSVCAVIHISDLSGSVDLQLRMETADGFVIDDEVVGEITPDCYGAHENILLYVLISDYGVYDSQDICFSCDGLCRDFCSLCAKSVRSFTVSKAGCIDAHVELCSEDCASCRKCTYSCI